MTIRRLLAAALAGLTLLATACATNAPPADTTAAPTTTAAPVTTIAPATTEAPATTAAPRHDIATMPRSIYGGAWDTSHVQGIAIDTAREHMYFSFTTTLVKTDLQGNVIGTVEGMAGHLGDLDFNDEDGRVYGSYEYKAKNAFYIAVFDVDAIDRVGMNCYTSGVMQTVALPEVNADFSEKTADGKQYRYGCSGIDGVAFGPAFGAAADSPRQLMVAYGIFKDNNRTDNDHQVILTYDWREFASHEKLFKPTSAHKEGPSSTGRYYVYTGNTNYGVQNLEYDASTGYWFLAAYTGSKTQFPNYSLFAVDGSVAPVEGDLVGMPTPERGMLLSLAEVGLTHSDTGIRGWKFGHPDTGILALDDGYFYISHDGKEGSKQTCTARLYRWVGKAEPFVLVD